MPLPRLRTLCFLLCSFLAGAGTAFAHATGGVAGRVLDQTGAPLAGVSIDLTSGAGESTAVSDARGSYRFDRVADGPAELTFRLLNFTVVRRTTSIVNGQTQSVDAVLALSLSADVVVTGTATFRNIADIENPAREPGRHRVGGEPGRDHRRTARDRPVMRAGRSARDRARPHRQPAQRGGQGEPVLPARLQPRSRDRLLDDRRRRAGEHADRRPRARLRRHQLSHPRAGQRRAVQEGPLLRGRGRLLRGRRRQHQLREPARRADRATERRQRRLGPRAGGGLAGRRVGSSCSAPSR